MKEFGERLVIWYAGLIRMIFLWVTRFGLSARRLQSIRILEFTSATAFDLMKNLKHGRHLPPAVWDSVAVPSSMGLITSRNHQRFFCEKPGRRLVELTAISGSGSIGIWSFASRTSIPLC